MAVDQVSNLSTMLFSNFVEEERTSRQEEATHEISTALFGIHKENRDYRFIPQDRSGGLVKDRSGRLIKDRSGGLMRDRSGGLVKDRSGGLMRDRSGGLVKDRSGGER